MKKIAILGICIFMVLTGCTKKNTNLIQTGDSFPPLSKNDSITMITVPIDFTVDAIPGFVKIEIIEVEIKSVPESRLESMIEEIKKKAREVGADFIVQQSRDLDQIDSIKTDLGEITTTYVTTGYIFTLGRISTD